MPGHTLYMLEKTLRVPDHKRFNHSTLKETNPGYSLEVLMLQRNNSWPPDAKN